MAVIQWAPLRDITTLQQQLDHLFDSHLPALDSATRDFVPTAELLTTDQEILVNIELPGVDPAAIDLQVSAQQVTVTGERLAPTIEAAKIRRSEFAYGKFQRRITLPEKVQNNNVTAKYDQGILRLVLPKLVDDQHKIVKVDIVV